MRNSTHHNSNSSSRLMLCLRLARKGVNWSNHKLRQLRFHVVVLSSCVARAYSDRRFASLTQKHMFQLVSADHAANFLHGYEHEQEHNHPNHGCPSARQHEFTPCFGVRRVQASFPDEMLEERLRIKEHQCSRSVE